MLGSSTGLRRGAARASRAYLKSLPDPRPSGRARRKIPHNSRRRIPVVGVCLRTPLRMALAQRRLRSLSSVVGGDNFICASQLWLRRAN